jgi:uncharacterized paraquat-inducible protein A
MTLIRCPECETQVSDAAAACPQCGHPLKATPAGGINMNDPVHLIGIAVAVLIIVWVTLATLNAVL